MDAWHYTPSQRIERIRQTEQRRTPPGLRGDLRGDPTTIVLEPLMSGLYQHYTIYVPSLGRVCQRTIYF